MRRTLILSGGLFAGCLVLTWVALSRSLHIPVVSFTFDSNSLAAPPPNTTDPLSSLISYKQFAVFFNIYVPTEKNVDPRIPRRKQRKKVPPDNAMRIIREQIVQVGSFTTSYNTFTVYYNTIGEPIDETVVNQICVESNVACQFMEHFARGFEEVTLQKMYEYCQTHETERVVYVHSKGSYNYNEQNEHWRRHMIMAVMDDRCLRPPNETCHVCGPLFQPIWMPMFPGNFFVSHCTYVNKLIPPMAFGNISRKVLRQVVENETASGFVSVLYDIGEWTVGLNRFAAEAWIGSHPDLAPCDMANETDVRFWSRPRNLVLLKNLFEWGMAPRQPLVSSNWFQLKNEPMGIFALPQKSLRMREYFLLAGKIDKWVKLYNRVPHHNSWVWNWFPDGDEWREAFAEHGNRTVDIMLEKYKNDTLDDELSGWKQERARNRTESIAKRRKEKEKER